MCEAEALLVRTNQRFDTHFHLVLSRAAPGGDAVLGKLITEIVGWANIINDLYAGPDPRSQKSGCEISGVGAGSSCRQRRKELSFQRLDFSVPKRRPIVPADRRLSCSSRPSSSMESRLVFSLKHGTNGILTAAMLSANGD
jgi:hypothetical protein